MLRIKKNNQAITNDNAYQQKLTNDKQDLGATSLEQGIRLINIIGQCLRLSFMLRSVMLACSLCFRMAL